MGVIQDVTRGVLGVSGMSYSFLLSMAQMLWDRAGSSGYVTHIEREPLPSKGERRRLR